MATTWLDISETLWRLLDDEISGTETHTFSEELLVWAWNAAQRHFTHHTPRQHIDSPLVVESDGRTVILPEDYFDMGRLYDPTSDVWWQSMQWQPGGYYNPTSETKAYAVWGNKLRLYEDVSESNSYELWYYAYWPDVAYGGDISAVVEDKILTPAWAECALLHLAAAFALQPLAVQAAKTRQWNMKLDSGTPIQNSRAEEAWDLYKWYTVLIAQHTPLERGGHT